MRGPCTAKRYCGNNFMEKSYNKTMRLFLVLIAALTLGACAGMPPAWWNPSGTAGKQAGNTPAPSVSAEGIVKEADVFPAEQDIEPVADSYEEENLSADELRQMQAAEADPAPEAAEEAWPEDGSLPPPSVLD